MFQTASVPLFFPRYLTPCRTALSLQGPKKGAGDKHKLNPRGKWARTGVQIAPISLSGGQDCVIRYVINYEDSESGFPNTPQG